MKIFNMTEEGMLVTIKKSSLANKYSWFYHGLIANGLNCGEWYLPL